VSFPRRLVDFDDQASPFAMGFATQGATGRGRNLERGVPPFKPSLWRLGVRALFLLNAVSLRAEWSDPFGRRLWFGGFD
jgi:hypothetical protein